MRHRLGIVVAVASGAILCLGTIGAPALAHARPLRTVRSPRVRSKTVPVTAKLDLAVSYHNHEMYGQAECGASTKEEASFDAFTYAKKVMVTEQSGYQQIFDSLQPGIEKHDAWSITGTQYIQGNDCSSPNQTLDCSGHVTYTADEGSLATIVHKGNVDFFWSLPGSFTEMGQNSCGSTDGEGFYFGLSDLLAPYGNVIAKIPLAKFAKLKAHDNTQLKTKPYKTPASYDPAHCNGAAQHYAGASCTGGGHVVATIEITKQKK